MRTGLFCAMAGARIPPVMVIALAAAAIAAAFDAKLIMFPYYLVRGRLRRAL